jgi:hypothetical protein
MNCEFSDILVLSMAFDWYSELDGARSSLTPEEIIQMEEIGAMLEEIGPLSVNDEIHAIYEAVKEIKDRQS